MVLIFDSYKDCCDFFKYDGDTNPEMAVKLEQWCTLVTSIHPGPYGNSFKDLALERKNVETCLDYIRVLAPNLKPPMRRPDSDEWKEMISKPSLKYVMRLLAGFAANHPPTQEVVSEIIYVIHQLEQVSSDEYVGTLAENVLEALRSHQKIWIEAEAARRATREEKKRMAMAMRQEQLLTMGMKTNEKGQVTAAASTMLDQMEDLAEETGLVCVICREGYKYQPTKVLGIISDLYFQICPIRADLFTDIVTRSNVVSACVQNLNQNIMECNGEDQLIATYSSFCGVSREAARQALDRSNWDIDVAVGEFLDNNGRQLVQSSSSNRLSANASTFSLLSWNIQGINKKNLCERMQAVVALIEKGNYSVVFLQEVTESAAEYLFPKLEEKYEVFFGLADRRFRGAYGNTKATLLRKNCVNHSSDYVLPFPESKMGRNLLVTKASIGKEELYFLNAHVESTSQAYQERMQQLKICFNHCALLPQKSTVIFGGDVNLRESDYATQSEVPVPDSMFDLWIHCGSQAMSEFTWDATKNTNIKLPPGYGRQPSPKKRFDRLYCRYAKPKTINAEFFGLTGLEKVEGTDCFPSDHWAIETRFSFGANTEEDTDIQFICEVKPGGMN